MASIARMGDYNIEQSRQGRRFDFGLLAAAAILLTLGLMALYSQGHDRPDSQFPKQLLNGAVGLLPFCLFAFVHPRVWQCMMPVVYGVNIALLLVVLKFGHKILGARRWLPLGPLQFQPTEIAKILLVITLASYFATRQDKIDKLSTFLLSFVHILVPLILVYKEPHLGATMVLVVIWLSISIAANVPIKFLGATFAAMGLAAVLVFSVPQLRSILPLHDYQKGRMGAVNGNDIKGNNYQTFRASIAFGVGGVNGAGFLKGEQKKAGYIPEQDNDFIFTVIGEEGGLVGCTLVLAAFAFFFFRIWLVMFQATEPYYRMIAAGILGLLAFHMVVNMAMVLGLIPVVGLWLPFFSAGGTALWLCMACVGLLLNIRSRERPVLFT